MPYPNSLTHRRIIPIQEGKFGTTKFRIVGGRLFVDRPGGTTWASCSKEKDPEKPTEPTYGIVGINSAGHPVYGVVAPEFGNFTSPCGEKK